MRQESWSRPSPSRSVQDIASQVTEEPAAPDAQISSTASLAPEATHSYLEFAPEPSAKVIEFPRSAAIPVFRASELAEPIFDRPRIVEAPEVLPSTSRTGWNDDRAGRSRAG